MKGFLYLSLILTVLYGAGFAESADFTDGFVMPHLDKGWSRGNVGDKYASYLLTGYSLVMKAQTGEHGFDLKVNFGALKIGRACPANFINTSKDAKKNIKFVIIIFTSFNYKFSCLKISL